MSHKSGGYPLEGPQLAIVGLKDHIEAVVGTPPVTCPWRVFYYPLVSEVIDLATLAESHLAQHALGDDPPAILLDALAVYLRARAAVRSHDLEEAEKERNKGK